MLQPVPEEVRTTRVSGQFWIWAGANIAPINWVLGALGIGLGLGLRDTSSCWSPETLVGMALFGVFVLIGQKTGVTGMVLSRAAFGRRGAYLPAAIQAALAVGWCAVNTWIILDLVMALLGKLGLVDPEAPNIAAKIAVAALIMAIQVTVAWFGYRTIAAFERWTVPPTLAVLILMSVVAWFHLHIDWSYAGPAGAGPARGGTDRRHVGGDDRDRHRLGHHVVHLRVRLLAVRQHDRAATQAVPGQHARPVHPGGLARRARGQLGDDQRIGRSRRADRVQLRGARAARCCSW